MGLLSKGNKVKKSKVVPDLSNGDDNEFVQAEADRQSYKASTIMSVGAIAAVLIGLLLFFMSDIPQKIVSAKATPEPIVTAVADESETEDTGVTPDVNYNGGDSYIIATLPGVIRSMDQDELLAQLEDMDEAEYDTFIASLAELINSDDPEAVIRDMDPQVSIYFGNGSGVDASGESVDDDSSESNADARDAERNGDIVDAYDAAEAIFGDAIDGSQRVKLIEELNAVDYKYYVAEDGDTLLELSKAFDIGLGQLVELNGINDADEIPAGMIVVLPSETEVSDDAKVVKK